MLTIDTIELFLNVERKKIEDIHFERLKSFEKKGGNEKETEKIKPEEDNKNELTLKTLNQTLIRPENIDHRNSKKLDKPLYSCFKSILPYQEFVFPDWKYSSVVASLFHSIFRICMTDYIYLENAKKETIIKEFIQKMEKDFIHRKIYLKNRKLQRTKVVEILRESYTLRKNDINIHILKQCICEYMGINLYVFHVPCEKDENNKQEHYLDIFHSEYYFARSIDKEKQPLCFLPSLFLFKENGIYKPILKKDEEYSILTYSQYKESIDLCWKYFMPVR
jgi:hypothetical protein